MTRKHFELVADVLSTVKPDYHTNTDKFMDWAMTVELFSNKFRRLNPRFDPERFRRACGMQIAES